mgnify:FL=1
MNVFNDIKATQDYSKRLPKSNSVEMNQLSDEINGLLTHIEDENIQEIADTVTYAVRADVREPGILKSLGVQNVDVAIIAVAENMEASITATMQVKDLGVPLVLAKAMKFPSWPDPGENWC